MILPPFLPPMLILDGEWDETLDMLYSVFAHDFIDSTPSFHGMRVLCDRSAGDRDLPNGFWHLVTKLNESERLVDFRRAERLPWARPIIENDHEPVIRTWDYEEGNKTVRTYLWLEQYGYVIVLQKKGRIAFVVTAYYVEGSSTRRRLLSKYEHRLT
jgi:hypothetical protein